jgi:hypothetical protein
VISPIKGRGAQGYSITSTFTQRTFIYKE